MERMQLKEDLVEEVRGGLRELYSERNFVNDPYMKSLFPKANYIQCYHHYVFGYDVIVVDEVFKGDYDDAQELLSYAYHTGTNYEDYDDLLGKYMDHLDCGNEPYGFLP